MQKSKTVRAITLFLAVAIILVALPAAAAQIETKEISYDVDGVKLTGYLAWDASQAGKRPGILIVHEWWGLNDYAKRRARMLAELGYVAFALDMYGDDKVTEHADEAGKFAMQVMQNLPTAVKRFDAAKKVLEEQPMTDASKIAAIGYCFGGGVVLHMARTGADLQGVATFHGSLAQTLTAKPGAIKAKILVLNGADDKMAPPATVAAFKKEMKDAGADLTFIDYPGAEHGFSNPDATELGKKNSIPISYNEKADKESWAELQKFLKKIFAE